MHISEIVIKNSGPIEDFHFLPELRPDGSPKPVVLVGSNGGGKTSILSIISDALILIAATHFSDVAPPLGTGHKFFRMIGSSTVRLGTPYELNLVRFQCATSVRRVIAKTGVIPPAVIAVHSQDFPELASLTDGVSIKKAHAGDGVQDIFRNGAYAFFPSGRTETPHWAQPESMDSAGNFSPIIDNQLRKPVVVDQSFDSLKPWLIDLILDASIDSVTILQMADHASVRIKATESMNNVISLLNVNTVIQTILGYPDAHFVRTGRLSQNRKIMIARTGTPIIPSLESLSGGQASLLAIFGTILRYGDVGRRSTPLNAIEGIVCIDEIDAQLHPSLQYDVLPKLIALFPRVQFIVSSHSPLFALGMAREFGEDGFTLLDMPAGNHIPVERYDDFLAAFEAFRNTQHFESAIEQVSSESSRPLVLCEGETDPLYLRVAAELLGFDRLVRDCDLDWLGRNTADGSQGSGKSNLNDAWKFLTNNPAFAAREIVLLYDNDARKQDADSGKIHIRSMPNNPENNVVKGGVEILLPSSAFEEQFYSNTSDIQGTTHISKKILNKPAFCAAICRERDPDKFEGFRSTLQMLDATLFGSAQAEMAH